MKYHEIIKKWHITVAYSHKMAQNDQEKAGYGQEMVHNGWTQS